MSSAHLLHKQEGCRSNFSLTSKRLEVCAARYAQTIALVKMERDQLAKKLSLRLEDPDLTEPEIIFRAISTGLDSNETLSLLLGPRWKEEYGGTYTQLRLLALMDYSTESREGLLKATLAAAQGGLWPHEVRPRPASVEEKSRIRVLRHRTKRRRPSWEEASPQSAMPSPA